MLVAFHPLRLRGVGERGVCHAWGFRWGDSGGDESLQSLLLPPPRGLCRAAGCRKGMPEAAGRGCGRRPGTGPGAHGWEKAVGQGWDFFIPRVYLKKFAQKTCRHPPSCPRILPGVLPDVVEPSQLGQHPPRCHGILPSTMTSPSLAAWEPIP